jgi:hypothetical protein
MMCVGCGFWFGLRWRRCSQFFGGDVLDVGDKGVTTVLISNEFKFSDYLVRLCLPLPSV